MHYWDIYSPKNKSRGKLKIRWVSWYLTIIYGICFPVKIGRRKCRVHCIQRQTDRHRRNIKNFRENLAAHSVAFTDKQDPRPIKLFFQDEARFGRIDRISSCWVPPKGRAVVGSQIIREYTYVYLTTYPKTYQTYSLILPMPTKAAWTYWCKRYPKLLGNIESLWSWTEKPKNGRISFLYFNHHIRPN